MKVFNVGGVDYRLPDIQTSFQQALYVHLINWKWQHISREPGADGDILYDAFLPEVYRDQFPFISFSVVHHSGNHQLDRSIQSYQELIARIKIFDLPVHQSDTGCQGSP